MDAMDKKTVPRFNQYTPLEMHLLKFVPNYSGTLTVEAIYQDRDQFAQLVREVASPDVGKMGIEVLSFTIKDINDRVEYLSSLGRAQTANVKRDADIGVAEANKDAGIRVSFIKEPKSILVVSSFSVLRPN